MFLWSGFFCFGLLFKGGWTVVLDDAGFVSVTTAPERQRPQPKICNRLLQQRSSRNFKVKKQNYAGDGPLGLNIPLTSAYEGNYNGNLSNIGLYDPVGFFTVKELVRRNKHYDVLEYKVTTEDSYILRLHRIVRKGNMLPNNGTPILFQHGMFGTAKDFLMLENAGSAPIISMEAGYDVWLANSRGTEESRDHEFFLPDDDRYWDFSVDELGRYDVKAGIDKVLKESRSPDLFYVGHSLGTMIFYVFMHYHGERYTNKIRGMAAMPPSAYLSNSETALLLLGGLEPIVAPFGVPINAKLPPFNRLLHRIVPTLCSVNLTDANACSYLLDVLAGKNDDETDPQVIKRMVEHYPNGLSAKALIHLLQLTRSDRFGMFDYGPARNVLKYGQPAPPSYNLFGIDVAALNIYGLQDLIVDRTDAERTVAAMGATKGKTNLLIQEFNHIDLILSKFAAPIINARILRFFKVVDVGPTINIRCSCGGDEPSPLQPTSTTSTTNQEDNFIFKKPRGRKLTKM